MYIPIENISRGIDESSNPLLTRTIGYSTISGGKFWLIRFRIIRHLDCSEQKHSLCKKAKESKKEGVEKRKLVSKGSARELKHNCRSKAKPKFNMKDIRKCHHPMHGAVS